MVESEALVVLREFAVVLSVVGWCELWFCALLVDSGLFVVTVLLSCSFVVSVPSVVVVVRFAPLLVSTGVAVWFVPFLVSAVVVVELSLFSAPGSLFVSAFVSTFLSRSFKVFFYKERNKITISKID